MINVQNTELCTFYWYYIKKKPLLSEPEITQYLTSVNYYTFFCKVQRNQPLRQFLCLNKICLKNNTLIVRRVGISSFGHRWIHTELPGLGTQRYFSLRSVGLELKRKTIDTKPLSSGLRAIIKHMTQMGITLMENIKK